MIHDSELYNPLRQQAKIITTSDIELNRSERKKAFAAVGMKFDQRSTAASNSYDTEVGRSRLARYGRDPARLLDGENSDTEIITIGPPKTAALAVLALGILGIIYLAFFWKKRRK